MRNLLVKLFSSKFVLSSGRVMLSYGPRLSQKTPYLVCMVAEMWVGIKAISIKKGFLSVSVFSRNPSCL